MSFELFVALRYLSGLRKKSFITVISIFSVLGVGIGVAALIVTMGVMNGFTKDFRDKILGINAHGLIGSVAGGVKDYQAKTEIAARTPGVTGASPFIYSEVMVSSEAGVKGMILRGLDPATAGQVLSLPGDMVEGSLTDLSMPALAPRHPDDPPTAERQLLPRLIIGQELAERLNLKVGSVINVLSPSGKTSAAGFQPRVKIFSVAGVFRTGMYEYDSSLGYATIQATQELLGFKEDVVTGLEIRVENIYDADKLSEQVRDELGGFPLYARNWKDMNANLFAALQLEKTGMFIVLVMIVLVGTFSIVTTLVMLVMEKTKDIAVLMSMGARPESIRRIFMFQGTLIGLTGVSIGFILGVGLSLILKHYKFIELPKGVYPMDTLPIRLEWPDLTLIGVAALALCFLATVYPARRAARLKPAEALHYE